MHIEITLTANVNGNVIRQETLSSTFNASINNEKHIAEFVNDFFDMLDKAKNAQIKSERFQSIRNVIHHNVQHNADDVQELNQLA